MTKPLNLLCRVNIIQPLNFCLKKSVLNTKEIPLIIVLALKFIDQAQEPQLSIIGVPRVGEQSIVSCSVRHTCLFAPPTLTLDGIPGEEITIDTQVSEGIWQRTVERRWTAEEKHKSVTCSVRYRGGQQATSELKLDVECESRLKIIYNVN